MIKSFLKKYVRTFKKVLARQGNIFSITNGCRGFITYFRNDATIGRSISKYGEWAENEICFLAKLIPKGGTVVDIGSNIGTHAIAFSQMVGEQGTVLAFEPQRLVHQVLCSNIVFAEATNVHTYWCALSDHSGFIEEVNIDYRESEQNFGAVFFRDNKASDLSYKSVPLKRLDDFSLQKCDLIKIDAEGMEEKILTGCIQTIKSQRPLIYFEAAAWEWVEGVEKFFSDKDYSLFLHFVDVYNPGNFKGNKENIFGAAKERNVLAIPKELHGVQSLIAREVVGFSRENFGK